MSCCFRLSCIIATALLLGTLVLPSLGKMRNKFADLIKHDGEVGDHADSDRHTVPSAKIPPTKGTRAMAGASDAEPSHDHTIEIHFLPVPVMFLLKLTCQRNHVS
jgi:hypothetical protein